MPMTTCEITDRSAPFMAAVSEAVWENYVTSMPYNAGKLHMMRAQPWFLLGLLRPAQDALLHVLVEDLLLVVAPHLRAQRETIDQCFEDINCVRYRRRTPMTHLGYNCIQRQGAVAAEKLDDDPASTRMGAGVRRTHMCFGRQYRP